MNTVTINCASIKNAEQFHEALARGLDFPEWYGHNLDALYDCLSERTSPVSLVVMNDGEGEVADALRKVRRVFADCNANS